MWETMTTPLGMQWLIVQDRTKHASGQMGLHRGSMFSSCEQPVKVRRRGPIQAEGIDSLNADYRP